jgi:tetratricopeptide (TPR) repeat protein
MVDRLEVRWLGGRSGTWTNIEANRIWEVTQGKTDLRPFNTSEPNAGASSGSARLDKNTLVRFWEKQRAAMDAMKRERNLTRATQLFREALYLNPGHEDSHYYLANCLAASGDVTGAIAELDALVRINSQSHRALQRKGELLAASASSKAQLERARQALNAALRLNSEETGALVLLGQVVLALGDGPAAEMLFAHACQANPRAANAFFFRGYIAWSQRDLRRASAMLEAARQARGRDWKPAGAVLEGDVKHRMYSESGFLSVFEQQWDGTMALERAYRDLAAYLAAPGR